MQPPIFSSVFRSGVCVEGQTQTGPTEAEALSTLAARSRSVVLSAEWIGRLALDCWNALPNALPGSEQNRDNCRVLSEQLIGSLVMQGLLMQGDATLQWIKQPDQNELLLFFNSAQSAASFIHRAQQLSGVTSVGRFGDAVSVAVHPPAAQPLQPSASFHPHSNMMDTRVISPQPIFADAVATSSSSFPAAASNSSQNSSTSAPANTATAAAIPKFASAARSTCAPVSQQPFALGTMRILSDGAVASILPALPPSSSSLSAGSCSAFRPLAPGSSSSSAFAAAASLASVSDDPYLPFRFRTALGPGLRLDGGVPRAQLETILSDSDDQARIRYRIVLRADPKFGSETAAQLTELAHHLSLHCSIADLAWIAPVLLSEGVGPHWFVLQFRPPAQLRLLFHHARHDPLLSDLTAWCEWLLVRGIKAIEQRDHTASHVCKHVYKLADEQTIRCEFRDCRFSHKPEDVNAVIQIACYGPALPSYPDDSVHNQPAAAAAHPMGPAAVTLHHGLLEQEILKAPLRLNEATQRDHSTPPSCGGQPRSQPQPQPQSQPQSQFAFLISSSQLEPQSLSLTSQPTRSPKLECHSRKRDNSRSQTRSSPATSAVAAPSPLHTQALQPSQSISPLADVLSFTDRVSRVWAPDVGLIGINASTSDFSVLLRRVVFRHLTLEVDAESAGPEQLKKALKTCLQTLCEAGLLIESEVQWIGCILPRDGIGTASMLLVQLLSTPHLSGALSRALKLNAGLEPRRKASSWLYFELSQLNAHAGGFLRPVCLGVFLDGCTDSECHHSHNIRGVRALIERRAATARLVADRENLQPQPAAASILPAPTAAVSGSASQIHQPPQHQAPASSSSSSSCSSAAAASTVEFFPELTDAWVPHNGSLMILSRVEVHSSDPLVLRRRFVWRREAAPEDDQRIKTQAQLAEALQSRLQLLCEWSRGALTAEEVEWCAFERDAAATGPPAFVLQLRTHRLVDRFRQTK